MGNARAVCQRLPGQPVRALRRTLLPFVQKKDKEKREVEKKQAVLERVRRDVEVRACEVERGVARLHGHARRWGPDAAGGPCA